MAEAVKTVTIINQREGKIILPPDAEALRAFEALPPEKRSEKDRPKPRELLAGRGLEVSAEEAEKLLNHKGIVDGSKLLGSPASSLAAEIAALKEQLAAEKAENAKLVAKLGDAAEPADLGDDDAVLLADGRAGVIVKVKKDQATVKLEDGSTVKAALSELKPAPAKE